MLDNLWDNYTLIAKIGEGSFSEVMKVQNKETGIFQAAKILTTNYATEDEAMKSQELSTLRKLEHHKNILSLIDFVYEPSKGTLTLIFDLMDQSMYDYIKNRNKRLPETKCKGFLYQMTQGLNHLHRNKIFHRDIKPENILIRRDSRFKHDPLHHELVQLADFGSVGHSDFPQPHSAYVSTRWYRAPECLLTSGFYGPKMDVWALGCCFYEILTNTPLFPGDNEIDQLHKIHEIVGTPPTKVLERFKHRDVKFDFPKKTPIGFHIFIPFLSEYGVDVLKHALVYHPDTRISAKKLLDHIYFEDLRSRNKPSSSRLMISNSVTSDKSQLTNLTVRSRRRSMNTSRDSLFSNSSGRDSTLRKLQEAQQILNKQLERGWGKNKFPVKAKIIKKSDQNN